MFSPEPDVSCLSCLFNYSLTALFSLGYAITCLIIYSSYSDIVCTNVNILSLQNWIFGCGIAYIILSIFHLSIFGIRKRVFSTIYYFYMFLLNLPFVISWNIIGSIILFRDSYSCIEKASPLWAVAISGLVYQWVSIITILWEMKCKYSRINGK
jgi:hypothetical protein